MSIFGSRFGYGRAQEELNSTDDDVQIPNTDEKLDVGADKEAAKAGGANNASEPKTPATAEETTAPKSKPAPKNASSTKKKKSDGPESSAKRQRTTTGTKSVAPRKKTKKAPLTAAQQLKKDLNESNEPSDKPTKPRKNKSAGEKTPSIIDRVQKGTEPLFSHVTFMRLVKEIMRANHDKELRIQLEALAGLQEITEAFLTERFHLANLASIHAGRVTIMKKDMAYVNLVRPVKYVPM